ncbi:MAG: Dph6-related ATP pyrophosphatase [Sulfuricaulis sp.]
MQTPSSVHLCKDPPQRRRPVREKVVLSWSGGKDSTMAAYHLIASQKYEIVSLLTTVTEEFDRISMHGVRRELLERQAESLGIPLYKVMIPKDCPNAVYEDRMREGLAEFKMQGISKVAFGDLFLEDLKQYRDERLAQVGMTGLYPIWMRDTDELVRTFIGLGFKAILACVDTQAIAASFAGREIDHDLLRELPESADPCGENGEYHSFVYDGPIFSKPIACKTGEQVMRMSRFNYCDILPA